MRQKINPEFIKGMEVWIVRNEQGRFTGWYGKRLTGDTLKRKFTMKIEGDTGK